MHILSNNQFNNVLIIHSCIICHSLQHVVRALFTPAVLIFAGGFFREWIILDLLVSYAWHGFEYIFGKCI